MAKKIRQVVATFRDAIAAAEHLKLLSALDAVTAGEGRGQIHVDAQRLCGSVRMDEDCKKADPRGNRWDYVIGVTIGKRESAIFVEVHSAETSNVSDLEKKLNWLLAYLNRDRQELLRKLPRQIYWVASGRVNIPKHLPQYRKLQTTLRNKGLLGPVSELRL